MKGFILGIIATMLVLGVGLLFALLGFVSMRADSSPSKLETAIAGNAMDAAVALLKQTQTYLTQEFNQGSTSSASRTSTSTGLGSGTVSTGG